MRTRHHPIRCRLNGAGPPFGLVAFDLAPEEDGDLIRSVVAEAERLKARRENTAGEERDPDTLRKTRYLGVLSERLLRHYLAEQLHPATVRSEPFTGHDNHIDLVAEADGKRLSLEVRGSFPFVRLDRVICELFDVIGPYETSTKQKKVPKDYYLRTLINREVKKFTLRAPHTLYFAGGAEIEMIRRHRTWSDFKQAGARYRTIKPICRARDAADIVDHIQGRLRQDM